VLWAFGGGSPGAAQERKRGGGTDGSIVKGTLASVDAEKNTVTVTIHTFNRATQEGKDTDTTFPLTKDAKVLQDGTAAKLSDLKKGNPVTVRLDGTNAASITVDGGTAQGEFISANPDRNTITVFAGRNMERRVYHLLKSTTVTGDNGKEKLVKDLKAGMNLTLTRSVEDDRTVVQIRVMPTSSR